MKDLSMMSIAHPPAESTPNNIRLVPAICPTCGTQFIHPTPSTFHPALSGLLDQTLLIDKAVQELKQALEEAIL